MSTSGQQSELLNQRRLGSQNEEWRQLREYSQDPKKTSEIEDAKRRQREEEARLRAEEARRRSEEAKKGQS